MSDATKIGAKNGPKIGRPKGSKNKTTKLARDAIALAAQGIGGADRLEAWILEDPLNERVFWSQIYPKLLPLQVAGTDKDGELAETPSYPVIYQAKPE